MIPIDSPTTGGDRERFWFGAWYADADDILVLNTIGWDGG